MIKQIYRNRKDWNATGIHGAWSKGSEAISPAGSWQNGGMQKISVEITLTTLTRGIRCEKGELEYSLNTQFFHQQSNAIFPYHTASIQFTNYFLLLIMRSVLKFSNTNDTENGRKGWKRENPPSLFTTVTISWVCCTNSHLKEILYFQMMIKSL